MVIANDIGEWETAELSTLLRFGRDDKGKGGASIEIRHWELEEV